MQLRERRPGGYVEALAGSFGLRVIGGDGGDYGGESGEVVEGAAGGCDGDQVVCYLDLRFLICGCGDGSEGPAVCFVVVADCGVDVGGLLRRAAVLGKGLPSLAIGSRDFAVEMCGEEGYLLGKDVSVDFENWRISGILFTNVD